MVRLLLILVIAVASVDSRQHPVPTYFKRADLYGNLVDRASSLYLKEISGNFVNRISRLDATTAVLKASPELVDNGGVVTVAWEGVVEPQLGDFVGFYCPADDKPDHFLDYFHARDAATWAQGYGSVDVVVFNMRTTCGFRYFRNQNFSQLVATSNEISFSNGGIAAPLHGHIASTGNSTQMRIMWVSGEDSGLLVRYGLSESREMTQRVGVSRTYAAGDMCESPANSTGYWSPGYLHDFLLEGLLPNTKYYYSFGSENFTSPVYSFTTDLPAGDPTPFMWIAYGDMGPYPAAHQTEKNIVQELNVRGARLVLHNGDISYAMGYAYVWDQWFSLVQSYATSAPFMITVGNHEQDHLDGGEHDPSGAPGEGFHPDWGNFNRDSGGECGVPMFHRFTMPSNGNRIWWYSFDYGLVHFVALSTEHDFRPGSPQYQWLEGDLRGVDRRLTPWVVVAGHRAMYCSALVPDDYVISENMQIAMEELFWKYRVDMGLWSHYHSYERTCRVYKQQCVDDGILHIVVGSAGADIDVDAWFPRPWSSFHINDWGYGRVTVANATALMWEWVQNKSGKVLDSYWLMK